MADIPTYRRDQINELRADLESTARRLGDLRRQWAMIQIDVFREKQAEFGKLIKGLIADPTIELTNGNH